MFALPFSLAVVDDDWIEEIVFCLRRLGEVTEVAAPRPVLDARRDCVTAGRRRRPPPLIGAVALFCNGRMDEVREGVNVLRRKLRINALMYYRPRCLYTELIYRVTHHVVKKPPVDLKTIVPFWPALAWSGQAKAKLVF